MNDAITRIAGALDELAAEAAHADTLIADQQARIETLERQMALLQSLLKASETAT